MLGTVKVVQHRRQFLEIPWKEAHLGKGWVLHDFAHTLAHNCNGFRIFCTFFEFLPDQAKKSRNHLVGFCGIEQFEHQAVNEFDVLRVSVWFLFV